MTVKSILLIFLPLLLFSCRLSEEKENSYVLLLNPDKSDVKEKRLIRDSILFQIYSKDSMLISRFASGVPLEFRFFRKKNQLFERRYRSNDFGEILGVDSILTFSDSDTTFLYESERKIYPLVQTYSYADSRYSIQKVGKEYITTKQSLIDTTYKEIYYYDKDYRPNRYVNTWKDNICVYEKKKE